MGQSTSSISQNDETKGSDIDPLNGDDEKFFSPVQSPFEEEDSSEFEDCEEDMNTNGEFMNEAVYGTTTSSSSETKIQRNEWNQNQPITWKKRPRRRAPPANVETKEADNKVDLNGSFAGVIAAKVVTPLSPIEEDENFSKSYLNSEIEVPSNEEFPTIDDKCAISILDSLIKGEYDSNIHKLWETVNSSQFNVEDNGFAFFLPAVLCSKLICVYFQQGGTSFSDISDFSSLLQNYVSEWINSNRGDTRNSFMRKYPHFVKYLYSLIKEVVYFLNMINETEKANRYFWILEYINVDALDPVSTVQSQVQKGSYRKKHGSRYDSNNEELGLFAMLSPSATDGDLSVCYSPTHPSTHDTSPTDSAVDSENWRNRLHRSGSYQKRTPRRYATRNSSFRGLQRRSQSLHALPTRGGNNAAFLPSSPPRELERWNSSEMRESRDLTLEESYRQEGLETTSWDQFTVNREKFGVESAFNESMYTVPMSSYQINEEEWKEVVSIAKEMGDVDDSGYLHVADQGDVDDSVLFSDVHCAKGLSETEKDDNFVDSAFRKKAEQ